MGVYTLISQCRKMGDEWEVDDGQAYGERAFESNEVLADALDCFVGYYSLAVFQLRCHVDWFPLYRCLHEVN